jgi:hypothetical protein
MRLPTREEFEEKKVFIITAGIAVIAVISLMVTGWDKVVNDEIDGGKFTLKGIFDCMPLKKEAKTDRPEECVLGFKSKRGLYYGLDISHIQVADSNIRANEPIAVTGFLAPKNATSTMKLSDEFDIVGVIQVNALLRTSY